MEREKMKHLVLIFYCFLSSITFAQNNTYQVGQKIESNYQVYTRGIFGNNLLHNIPLPDEKWEVILINDKLNDITVGSSFTRAEMREAILINTDEKNKLKAAMYIYTTAAHNNFKWIDDYCTNQSDNLIYLNLYGTALYEERCLSIQLNTYLQGSGPRSNYIREYFNARGINYSLNMLKVRKSKISSSSGKILVELYIFPDYFNFENPKVGAIGTHPWHKSNFKNDPKKIQFIEKLINWSEEYSNSVHERFKAPDKQVPNTPFFHYIN